MPIRKDIKGASITGCWAFPFKKNVYGLPSLYIWRSQNIEETAVKQKHNGIEKKQKKDASVVM